ncbi:MAG: hypothetical protein H0U50_08250, partial [Pyrinomonadaceae bacterium]|nr:hypothetical protein [Pyrinomonadaceae bacterium]
NISKGDPEIYKVPIVRLVDVAGANPQYDGFEKLIGREEDRPIGIRKLQNGGLNFEPYWVTLSFENALRAASDNPTNKGIGIVEINYTDNVDFKGDYTIYLQIERLP